MGDPRRARAGQGRALLSIVALLNDRAVLLFLIDVAGRDVYSSMLSDQSESAF